MPRFSRSALIPTAPRRHGRSRRIGAASGAAGLVARFHEAGGDVVHFQVSFWLMMPVSAAVAAFFGVLFGFPTLRLKGDYLAIVTLGFGEIVPIVARNTPSVTNGAMGLNGVAAPQLFGWSFGVDATPYYYVGLALVALLIVTSQRLKDLRIGRARWQSAKTRSPLAMGVDRVRYKLCLAIGAAFAGATGTFYVAKLQTATQMFMFPVSVMVLVMVVFGGIGSVWESWRAGVADPAILVSSRPLRGCMR
jgi:branched-chain amino acid transport system permease protein